MWYIPQYMTKMENFDLRKGPWQMHEKAISLFSETRLNDLFREVIYSKKFTAPDYYESNDRKYFMGEKNIASILYDENQINLIFSYPMNRPEKISITKLKDNEEFEVRFSSDKDDNSQRAKIFNDLMKVAVVKKDMVYGVAKDLINIYKHNSDCVKTKNSNYKYFPLNS